MLTLVDSNPKFTVTSTGTVFPQGRLGSICWLLTSVRVSRTTLHAGFRFNLTAVKWVCTLLVNMKWVWICFGLTHRWRSAKTHTGKRTLTQCRHSYPHPSTDAYIKQESRVMCTNYTYSIKPAAKKKKKSAVKRIPERNQIKPGHDGRLIIRTSHSRGTHLGNQLCASFLPHIRKKNPGSFYLSTISCLNTKVVWVTANRIISNLIIIQTTMFMQITDPSSPFLTSFMWLDQSNSLSGSNWRNK